MQLVLKISEDFISTPCVFRHSKLQTKLSWCGLLRVENKQQWYKCDTYCYVRCLPTSRSCL